MSPDPTANAYIQGQDLPDLAFTLRDDLGQVIDFSTGYTFQIKVAGSDFVALVTKTLGITGASTAPNITVSWAATGELNTIPPGTYIADLIATRTVDNKQRKYRFVLPVRDQIT